MKKALRAKIVEVMDENRPAVLKMIMSMYLDDECMYCRKKFTMAQLKSARAAHPNPFGRIVHAGCWKKHNRRSARHGK